MFLTVNHFKMFQPGSVNVRCGALQIQTRAPIKSIRKASNFTKHCASQNMKSNKMNIIQPKGPSFLQKIFRYNPLYNISIFKSYCNLATIFFLVIVTDYDFIYFVTELYNFIACNQLLLHGM